MTFSSPTKLLAVLDSTKDKLSAENDALAAEGENLKELWQVQPQWSSAATINFLIQENLRLKCKLCQVLDRAGVALPLNPGNLSSVAPPNDVMQSDQQGSSLSSSLSLSPPRSKSSSAATSSASPSESASVSASASASASAEDGDGASDGGGDQTSLGTQSEAGADGQVTDEDIDAALDLFFQPSPDSPLAESLPATDSERAHRPHFDKPGAPDIPEQFIR